MAGTHGAFDANRHFVGSLFRLTTRLFGYAETLAPESDFFIRKAIGWALRDYARWNPQAVRDFVEAMGGRLSPLSAREAMRRIA